MDVAAFLSDIFPNIQEMSSMAGTIEEGEEAEWVDKLWNDVESLIPAFLYVRTQEHVVN
jgi:hypothetical protein